jgi:hypothetical protein
LARCGARGVLRYQRPLSDGHGERCDHRGRQSSLKQRAAP